MLRPLACSALRSAALVLASTAGACLRLRRAIRTPARVRLSRMARTARARVRTSYALAAGFLPYRYHVAPGRASAEGAGRVRFVGGTSLPALKSYRRALPVAVAPAVGQGPAHVAPVLAFRLARAAGSVA